MLGFVVLRFVLFDANWGLVAINRKLFFVGSYPADEAFRIWIVVFLGAALASLTYGVWIGRLRSYLLTIAIVAVIILTFGLGLEFQIREFEFTNTIESGGQTTVVTGIDRQLIQSGGWAPGWLYALFLRPGGAFRRSLAAVGRGFRGPGRGGGRGARAGPLARKSDPAPGLRGPPGSC